MEMDGPVLFLEQMLPVVFRDCEAKTDRICVLERNARVADSAHSEVLMLAVFRAYFDINPTHDASHFQAFLERLQCKTVLLAKTVSAEECSKLVLPGMRTSPRPIKYLMYVDCRPNGAGRAIQKNYLPFLGIPAGDEFPNSEIMEKVRACGSYLVPLSHEQRFRNVQEELQRQHGLDDVVVAPLRHLPNGKLYGFFLAGSMSSPIHKLVGFVNSTGQLELFVILN